jgi:DNA-binding NarL/FixJ family response regulator
LLGEHPEFDLAGEAEEAQSLLELAAGCKAELIVMDEELPGLYLEDLIVGLHALEPRPIVVVVTSELESNRNRSNAGADAFVSKGYGLDSLIETLQKYERRLRKVE